MSQHPLRRYWRVLLVVVLVIGSGLVVTGGLSLGAADATPEPGPNGSVATESSFTTLNYGLELAGGTRIRAPLIGVTAEGVTLDQNQSLSRLEEDIATHLSATDAADITVRPRVEQGPDAAAIEVTSKTVTQAEFAAALDAENITYDRVRDGVTAETRAETVRVLNNKISKAGLSGGTAREVTAGSNHFILIEIPDQRREEVIDLVEQRGTVQVDIYYPTTENGSRVYKTEKAVLEQGDFRRVGSGSRGKRLGPHVSVVLTDDAAKRFQQTTIETGLAKGGSRCQYERAPNSTGACLLTKVDGKVVYAAGMSPDLGQSIASGNWRQDASFVLQTKSYEEARELSLHLRAGSLPAALNMSAGTSTYVSPTQGEHFKQSGLLIGLAAVLAVTLKVFYRYRDLRIAGPMMATALSEVVILFGVAAILGYPIDLAVIGGFIAVIGTGVDDLIIVANELLQKGDVNSERVFRSRFKKAFWVIGAAALTTGIALSPLMVLSLGDLRGFAIFTLIGVIIGVTITRPAYGDILNYLLIDKHHD